MWVVAKERTLINMDWVESFELFEVSEDDYLSEARHLDEYKPFEIRACLYGRNGWFSFGCFKTRAEAEPIFEKIKLKLLAKQ